MTIPEKAVKWALGIANDDTHGYDQASRWGKDYDCSSLVISAYKHAGVPLTCTYTGNMRNDMLLHGFAPASTVNLKTGKNLKKGDVLLNEVHHTAMYVGDGKIVHAAGNEYGKATGGKTGDQTGKEICVTNYFNFPWDTVLRYSKKTESGETYIVQKGDSLWGIAERLLGAGERYIQIMSANNMVDSLIYPGQVLIIPSGNNVYKTIQITIKQDTYTKLSIMADEFSQTIGQCVDALMEEL